MRLFYSDYKELEIHAEGVILYEIPDATLRKLDVKIIILEDIYRVG